MGDRAKSLLEINIYINQLFVCYSVQHNIGTQLRWDSLVEQMKTLDPQNSFSMANCRNVKDINIIGIKYSLMAG